MMVDEMGKSIAQGGGIGIADQLYAEMIKQQEVGSDGQSTSDD
jgi:Rod binding domain-containing protein